jgi:hypothetical protein
VHNPKRQPENPCIAIMSSVLGMSLLTLPRIRLSCKTKSLRADHFCTACWASAGYNAGGCAAIENQLRKCMDGPAPPPAPANTINYHLSRMQKHVLSPKKQK